LRRRAWTALALALLPAALTVAAAGPAGAAAPAAAAGGQPSRQSQSLPVSIAITSLTPDYLTPGKPVTVTGSVTNTSGTPITGMRVRLRSTGTRSRSTLTARQPRIPRCPGR
jgi:protocatechuate 3,4-dioxygenase beta subunit